jgi:hypothetical protein
LTDAPIPWPIGSRDGHRAIILFGDLVQAVATESAQAVGHWWNVGSDTVWKWRKTLGVDNTEGTHLLHRETALGPAIAEARKKAWSKARDPERRRKIAEAKRGKPRPPQVGARLRKANLGRKATDEARANMSKAQKRRGAFPPAMSGPLWTPEEAALLGTRPDKEVAARIGRSVGAVHDHRRKLGIRSFYKRKARSKPAVWTPAQDALLGTMPDPDLARKLGCPAMAVFYRRRKLKIPPFRSPSSE